ncbi:MAG: matrixin family metalloprotease [marine benthic group bacterium]|nr:matrixin family metalloprotease [Gemmatimonadota bacterium]
MNTKENPILESARHRGHLRRTGCRRAVVVGVAAWVAMAASPAAATAQADYTDQAVVPSPQVYVGSPDGGPEPTLPLWRTTTDERRTLWVYFMEPPPERPHFWDQTVRAMATWNEVGGVPLRFQRTRSAQSPDVEFRWIRQFEAHQAGTTDWETDGEGWLSSAVVTLATQHEGGTSMSDEFVLLVALHELGHVIGLPHSDDPSDVMHPGNRNMALSDRDVRSARQLYERLESEKVTGP